MNISQVEKALEGLVEIQGVYSEDSTIFYNVDTINYKDMDDRFNLACMLKLEDDFLSIETTEFLFMSDDVPRSIKNDVNRKLLSVMYEKNLCSISFDLLEDEMIVRTIIPLHGEAEITYEQIRYMAINLTYMADCILPDVLKPLTKYKEKQPADEEEEDNLEIEEVEFEKELEKVAGYLKELKDSSDSSLV